MGWAARHIERLRAGETASFRPHGGSMRPYIESGQLVTVAPLSASDLLEVGDVVLCRVSGTEYLHRIGAVRSGARGPSFRIENARGHVNGWASARQVFGRVVRVEP